MQHEKKILNFKYKVISFSEEKQSLANFLKKAYNEQPISHPHLVSVANGQELPLSIGFHTLALVTHA